jgi:hypothetical protein
MKPAYTSSGSPAKFIALNSAGQIRDIAHGAWVAIVNANVADYWINASSLGGGYYLPAQIIDSAIYYALRAVDTTLTASAQLDSIDLSAPTPAAIAASFIAAINSDLHGVAEPAQQIGERSITRGNEYGGANGRPFPITRKIAASWPTNLNDWTLTFVATKDPQNTSVGSDDIEGSISVDVAIDTDDDRQAVSVSIDAADTSAAAPGFYLHSVRGALIADPDVKWTLELGTLLVTDDPSEQ